MFPNLAGTGTSRPPVNSTGLGGDNRMNGPIATQNLGGNSLTQQLRSLQNYQTTQGASTFGQGGDITNAALPGFNVAGESTGTAMDTTGKALATLNPAESYWTKLLSGDQATMNEAIAPFATQAASNFGNAVTQVGQNTPRGGYSAALQSQLPFAQAQQVNNQLYSLQPTAATNLNTIAGTKNAIAGTQGNIGGIQGQIANLLASVGIDVSKLGLGLLGQGSDSLLTGRGQDVAEHGQSMNLAGQAGADLSHAIKAR